MKKISFNKLLKKGNGAEELNYCIVIPFTNADEMKSMTNHIKDALHPKKIWCDGMIIDKVDYEKLIEKSKSIEILNEIEDGNE